MQTSQTVSIAIIVALLSSISTYTLVGDSSKQVTHYCEELKTKAYCYDLSSTSKTCYTKEFKLGGKSCTGVWKLIPSTPVTQWSCDAVGCFPIYKS